MRKYFGEIAIYNTHDQEEKLEAKDYLLSWKKFFIRNISRDTDEINFIDEQWIERPPEYIGCLCDRSSIALKICLDIKQRYELR